MIQFKCQQCGHAIKVGDAFAGKKGKCPHCKNPVEVPRSAASSDVGLVPVDEDGPAQKPAAPKKPAAVPAKSPAVKAGPPAAARSKAPPPDEVVEVVEEVEEVEEDVEVVVEEAPRKKRRPADDEEEDRPRAGKKHAVAEDEDEPEEDEGDRPRRKKKGRRGEWADCPECGCPGHAEKVKYTWWGGILAPALFSIVECNKCGSRYNGKSGKNYTVGMILYLAFFTLVIGGLFFLAGYILWSRNFI
jgi:hypothetical protein